MEDLADILEECLAVEKPPKTALALSLQKAHEKLKKKIEETEPEKVDQLAVRVEDLNKAASEGNLAWMDYPCWMRFPLGFRKLFRDLIDPIIFSGVYFEFNRFENNLYILLAETDPKLNVTLHKELNNFRIFVFDFRSSFKESSSYKSCIKSNFIRNIV